MVRLLQVGHHYLIIKTPKDKQPTKPPPKKASRQTKPATRSRIAALENQLKGTKLKDPSDPNKHAWANHIRLSRLPSGIKPAPKQTFELSTASDWEDKEDPEETPTTLTVAASRPIPPPKYMDKDSDTDSD